jgi:hypothetical protein
LDAADRPATEAAVAGLAREIGLAKVWHVVEFLAGGIEGTATAEPLVGWLQQSVPAWLRSLDAAP